jgi:hypothetical protein
MLLQPKLRPLVRTARTWSGRGKNNSMSDHIELNGLFDADAYWRSGGTPWTFFAYPRVLADEHDLPPDDEVKQLFAELLHRGLQVGIWADSFREDTIYLACPKEEIARLHEILEEFNRSGLTDKDFWYRRCEELFARVPPG